VYTGINSRGGLAQVARVSTTVAIHGGYATTVWTRAEPVANPTMQDAQQQGRVSYIGGYGITTTLSALTI
jgi:hypothetical protein